MYAWFVGRFWWVSLVLFLNLLMCVSCGDGVCFDIVGVTLCVCRVVEVVDGRLCTGCGVWVFRVGWVCVAVCGCCVYGVGGRLWWLMCVCADVCV